jgi:hypothetical protein
MSIYPYLRLLLDADTLAFLTSIWRLAKRWVRPPQGMYEVLDYETTLELKDTKGKTAIHHKRQRVRFLQDNIIAYQDQAWGDGNLFADYQCSPGVPVDRYQDGNRYRVLISLRESKSKGQIEQFYIERKIEDGFTREDEYFQAKIDHATQRLTLRVIFPAKRLPKQVSLFEQNINLSQPLQPHQVHTLPDKRQQVTWEIKQPRQFETYTLRWMW